MSIVLAFALRHWQAVAGGFLALSLALILWAHVHHGHKMAEDLRKARADNKLWAQAYHDEKRAVDLQNDAIGKWAVRAADWQRDAQAATAEAHRANLKAQASAADFLKRQPKGATACERTDDVAAAIRKDMQQ